MAMNLERFADVLDKAVGQSGGAVKLIGAELQQGKLIASQSRDRINGPHACSDPVGYRLQERVPDRVAQRVIDLLEVIEIEVENGQCLSTLDAAERLFHL